MSRLVTVHTFLDLRLFVIYDYGVASITRAVGRALQRHVPRAIGRGKYTKDPGWNSSNLRRSDQPKSVKKDGSTNSDRPNPIPTDPLEKLRESLISACNRQMVNYQSLIMGRQSDAKERMMQAILDLLAEGSYGALRIDDICERAGVKKGSFYYFFPSKEQLLIAALDNLWETDWKPFLDQNFSPSLPPLERLGHYLSKGYERQKELLEKTGKVCGCSILSLASEVSTLDEAVAAATRQLFARKRRYFESCIRDAIAEGEIPPGDVAARAAGLWALIEGVFVQARILDDIAPLKHMPQLAITFLKTPVEEPLGNVS